MEKWKSIPECPRYQVSSLGRVRGYRGHILKPWKGKYYLTFKAPKGDGTQTNMYVHTAVASAFIGPRPNGHEICHCNGDPLDNRADNLRYDTPKNNNRDKISHGTILRGESIGNSRFKEADILKIRSDYCAGKSISQLARDYSASTATIFKIVKRESWRHI